MFEDKNRSAYGCLDMIGNVEEWTSTPGRGGNLLILGGSWAMSCEVYGLPVLERLAAPDYYAKDQGFRCAQDPR
jgi:formylglycine-generating enzyme required for sulfatase activity